MKKYNRNTRYTEQGFTLIETALVLIVLSIVLAPLFNFMSQQMRQDQMREEAALDERVLGALAQFFKSNDRYPCPADATLAPGAANFGVEVCPAAGTPPVAGNVLTGALPTNTLNIPFQDMVNPHGWKYIYAVSDGFWDSTVPNILQGQIQINNTAGAAMVANAHFVIVNPGRDGKGSRTLTGAASTTACATALDTENCDGDNIFVIADNSPLDNPSAANYYDDTLSYTLAREESTFWVVDTNNGGTNLSNGTNIINRNAGSVGIGTFGSGAAAIDPNARLHVRGGNVRITDDGTGNGGSLNADANVTATGNVTATNNVGASNRAIAPVFWYGPPP